MKTRDLRAAVAVGAALVLGLLLLMLWDVPGLRATPQLGASKPDDPAGTEVTPAGRHESLGPRIHPRTPIEATETAQSPTSRCERLVLVGRIVDERHRPVAQAPIRLMLSGVPSVLGHADGAGRFALSLSSTGFEWSVLGTVIAGDTTMGVCVRSFSSTPENLATRDLGDLVLQPWDVLQVFVSDGGQPAAGARVAIAVHSSAAGIHALDEVECDREGRATLAPVPLGTAIVVASAGRRVGKRACSVPWTGEGPLVVDLFEGRTLDVKVVSSADEKPVANARISVLECERDDVFVGGVHPSLSCTNPIETDDFGVARITGLSREAVLYITAGARGFLVPRGLGDATRVESFAKDVTVKLTPESHFSFPLSEEESVADGTALEVLRDPLAPRSQALPSQAHVSSGTVVVDGCPVGFRAALVRAPDGRIGQIAWAPRSISGAPVRFRKARFLEVEVRGPDGRSIEGATVEVHSIPNYGPGQAQVTNQHGIARIGPFWGGTAEVIVQCAGGEPKPYGSANMDAGDVRLAVEVLPSRQLVLRFTLDGQRALPPDPLLWLRGGTSGKEVLDGARAELRCPYWADPGVTSVIVELRTARYRRWSTAIPIAETSETTVLDVDLVSGPSIVVKVVPPPDSETKIELLHWRPEEGRFRTMKESGAGQTIVGRDPTSVAIRFSGLEAGRWCARDRLSGLMSAECELGTPVSDRELLIDLSRAGWVAGRVETPSPSDRGQARVSFSGDGIQQPAFVMGDVSRMDGVAVNPLGAFRLRVPGDRAVRLVPTHPVLVPAAVDGEATVIRPRDGIVLRLVAGGRASFVVGAPESPASSPDPGGNHRVLLFRSVPSDSPSLTRRLELQGGKWSFTDFESGNWTLWLDLAPFQPKVLVATKLDVGELDLGVVQFDFGSEVVITPRVPASTQAAALRVIASSVDPPYYVRTARSAHGEPCTLRGLGAGSFTLKFLLNDAVPGGERSITSDGRNPIRISYEYP